tara:strand:+ start:6230 stop:11680 length:5451 start_codon:yes stop_codon:yes gene_type:complete
VRESPIDILNRSRKTLLESIGDNIGKHDASADYFFSVLSAERAGYIIKSEDESLFKMSCLIIKEEMQEESPYGTYHQEAGQELMSGGAYDDQRVINPRPDQSLTGRNLEMAQGDVDDAHKNHNYFDYRFLPLMHGAQSEAGPQMHQTISDFYLPSDAYVESRSQIDGRKEMAWEDHHAEGPHDFLRNPHHYGKLSGEMTNHSLYQSHYDDWIKSNDGLKEQIKEQFPNATDDEIDHECKKRHMEEARQGWSSDAVDENGIPQGLGLMDYLLGLEWLTPSQRHEVYEHISHKGTSDPHDSLRLNIGHSAFTVPRLIRNFHQRFSGMYNHWIRDPDEPGEPILARPKNLSKKTVPKLEDNFHAFSAVPNGYSRALNHMKERALVDDSFLQESMEGYEDLPDGMPYIDSKTGKVNFSNSQDNVGRMRRNMLMHLLNLDVNTGEMYNDNEHPYYDDWKKSESPFTDEEIKSILGNSQKRTLQTQAGRIARNNSIFHYGTFLDPTYWPEELTEGENRTLATHWHEPFFGKGGMGKHPNTLYNLLHEHSLLYGGKGKLERHSSFGSDEGFNDPYANLEEDEKGGISVDDRANELSLFFQKNTGTELENQPVSIGGEQFTAKTPLRVSQNIGIRHGSNRKGEIYNHGVLNLLGPFGQAEPELTDTRVKTGKKDESGSPIYRDVKRRETGDIRDAESNLHPHNVFMTGQGNRASYERHAASANGPFHNEAARGHYDAFMNDDNKTMNEMKLRIAGNRSGTLPWSHAFASKGGALAFERQRRKRASKFHTVGTMLHMGSPPLSPGRGVHNLTSPRPETIPTAHSVDVVNSLARDATPHEGVDEMELADLFDEVMHLQTQMQEEQSPQKREHMRHMLENLQQEYKDLEAQSYASESQEGSLIGMEGTQQDTFADKLRGDVKAIGQAGGISRGVVEEAMPDAFNPDVLSLEQIDANVRQLARMGNDLLQIVPHEMHGISTIGPSSEHTQTKGVTSGNIPSKVKAHIHNSPNTINVQDSAEEVADILGLDYDQPHAKETVDSLLEKIKGKVQESGDGTLEFPVMTVAQMLGTSNHYGDFSGDLRDKVRGFERLRAKDRNEALVRTIQRVNRDLSTYDPRLKGKGRTAKEGVGELMAGLGLDWHTAHHSDPRSETDIRPPNITNNKTAKLQSKIYRTLQNLDSVLISDPRVEPKEITSVDATRMGLGPVPVDRFGPNSYSVQSIYNSTGFKHELGDQADLYPTFDYRIHKDGKVEVFPNDAPFNLVQPTEDFYDLAVPHLKPILHTEETKKLHGLHRMAPNFWLNSLGYRRLQNPVDIAKSNMDLAALTNPDVIRKELGKDIPLLQPMHRIFEIEDLEHLRGFTGDWIVSAMPKGERGFVKKEDDDITSPSFTLSDEDKTNFGKVTDKDFQVDVVKTEEGYYIFDVIEYDGKEVHDTLLDDRIKILRGGMEGIENIHVPSASDTRLTDDAGLELTVENLQEDNEQLLMRDAKSTYMVGEMRHPKWVLLSPGNDVVLVVLERRGNGPYTYRLGTGPITQEEELGSRGVELNGDTYMDMGAAFDSSEKYKEGDHVRVNVSNVGVTETTSGQKLYNVSGSEIQEEAEGEGLVSQETLGILAKSETEQWLCEVSRSPSGVRITMPQGDVIYKTTQTGSIWTVHSPLAPNHYLIRLSESQRQYWSPVAGAMLKANLEIAEKEEVHETEGDSKPLIPPKKVEGTDFWNKQKKQKILVKGAMLLERMMKSGAGLVGQSSTGTMGLGIDYATPIESPTGPTNLNDSKTMPDYDNKKRPGEDYSIEPKTEDSEDTKHLVVPVEGGTLEVTRDTASFRT